ncbi:MAG TPA: 50S ribosomal protein L24 [Candidatus Absconditabacterales bacterium]|nr:50S ribosomal protein L24 [Candidatus Absconditabacterales bacterium]
MKKLRAGDPVIMITGKYTGKISTIKKFVDDDRVIVEGVNEVKKAVKGKGFIKKTLPVHVSNLMYYVEDQKKATKIKIVTDKKGKKTREATKFKLTLK